MSRHVRSFGETWIFPVIFAVAIASLSVCRADDLAGVLVDSNSVSTTTPPKIKLEVVGKEWENITGRVGSPPKGMHSLYSLKGDDLLLSCSAQFPIQWKIRGIIAPEEIVKYQQPKRDIEKNIFTIRINIFFLDADNYRDLAASAILACEEIQNSSNRDEVAIFVKGNNGKTLLEPHDTHLQGDVTLIPCPTTQPTSSTKPVLYFKNSSNGPEVRVEDVEYSPVEGFRLTSPDRKVFSGGTYICKKGTELVTLTLESSSSPIAESHFSPVSNLTRKFSDESIYFECSSKTKPVNILLNHNSSNKIVVTDIKNSDYTKSIRLHLAPTANLSEQLVLQGKAVCVAEGDQLIKEWVWEFVEPPQLYLDNFEGEADCLSPLTPKIVQTVRCKDAMDCKFMERCLRNQTLCNFKKQKQFFADFDTYCWVGELKKGFPCVSVPFSHLNGLVKCGVMGLEKRWEFFISLDYVRYSHWKNAPRRELLRIEEFSEDEDVTSSESTKFVCTASAYLFADSLAFELQYKNGFREIIQSEVPTESLSQGSKTNKILELTVKAVLYKKDIPHNAIAIDCLAPFWNSTEILRVSKFLGGKRMSALKVGDATALLLEKPKHEEEYTFYIGEKNKRLNCTLSEFETQGPLWIYRNGDVGDNSFKNASNVFQDLKVGVNGSQFFLEFGQVEKKHAGDYQCVTLKAEMDNIDQNSNAAISDADISTVFSNYKLHVSAEPLPASTTVWVGLTILILLVLGIGIAGFAVFMQKRNT